MSSNILSSHAEQDLNQIWFDVFQASKSEALADKYIDGLLSTIDKIRFPHQGESRDYLVEGFRKWRFKKYLIYYSLRPFQGNKQVVIERVILGKRDQGKPFEFE